MIKAISPEVSDENPRVEFERLALPHMDSLYRTAVGMTGSRDEAEDLVQETFLKAYRAFNGFERGTNCRAWLFRIMANSNINHFRRRLLKKDRVRYDDVQFFVSAPEEAETSGEDMEELGELVDGEVKAALERLPEYFRRPLLLSAVEDLSYKEISKVLNCPIGTVMSRIHRGRQMLRADLAEYAKARGYRQASA
jgi:RNA polymerase sigma-70 factor (ECF subfamily)